MASLDKDGLQTLLKICNLLKIDPDTIQNRNPFELAESPIGKTIAMAADSEFPGQAAKWRAELEQGLSLNAAAAREGLIPITKGINEELKTHVPGYADELVKAQQLEEQQILEQMTQEADQLRRHNLGDRAYAAEVKEDQLQAQMQAEQAEQHKVISRQIAANRATNPLYY